MYGKSITRLSITNNRKYSKTDNFLYYNASRIILPVIHGWASLFGNYFAMTFRGGIHGCIIPVLCAKPYKRGEYANGKNSDYIQRPPGGRGSASGRSDEPEKPAYRAAQCEQCKGGGHPCPHVSGRGGRISGHSQRHALHEAVRGKHSCHQARQTLLPLPGRAGQMLESSRKNPVPLSNEELSESISSSHRHKPNPRNW